MARPLPAMSVVLRSVVEDDLPILFVHQLDPEATQMAAFPSRDRDAFEDHWRKLLLDERVVVRAIVVDGDVVGNIGSWRDDEGRYVGYWIGREHWGQGIATAALSAFLEEMRERPVTAFVVTHNAGSIRVLEKCGFTRVGEQTTEVLGVVADEYVYRLS